MTNFLSRLRFLPVTIFAAALMLTVKVGDIWDGFDGVLNGSISVSAAKAQQAAPPTAPAPQAAASKNTPPAPVAADKTTPPAPSGKLDNPAAPAASPPPPPPAAEDPTLLTQAEIELLQKLAERRELLDQRETEISQRQGLLKAAESRIDKKVEELKLFQETISKLIKTYNDQQNAKMASLVKIYEAMKPKDAALIFQELDMDTLLLVAERMKENKLAPIMAKMNPARATEITVELSRLRNLPKSGPDAGG